MLCTKLWHSLAIPKSGPILKILPFFSISSSKRIQKCRGWYEFIMFEILGHPNGSFRTNQKILFNMLYSKFYYDQNCLVCLGIQCFIRRNLKIQFSNFWFFICVKEFQLKTCLLVMVKALINSFLMKTRKLRCCLTVFCYILVHHIKHLL